MKAVPKFQSKNRVTAGLQKVPTRAPSSPFVGAFWIWPDSHFWDLHNGYALFRKEFQIELPPDKSVLHITADQSYQLYVNGRYICRGPARGFQHQWPYDTVDIGPMLQPGRNVLAIRAHNPGFSNFQYLTQGFAGLLVSGIVGGQKIISDNLWKCRRQNGVQRDTLPVSVQLFCQEHIDLRVEDDGWAQPDFDDSAWTAGVACMKWNSLPWYSLQKRGIPLLEENEITPEKCIGLQEGRSQPGYRTSRDVSGLILKEGLAHRSVFLPASRLDFAATGKGRWRRVLIDFGHTVVGSIGFRISSAMGGEIVDTICAEVVDGASLSALILPESGSRPAFAARLVCQEGQNEHCFYHPFGFRYLLITVRDNPGPLVIRPFLRTTYYPLKVEGKFYSSDPHLNQIWNACVRTQRVCSLDAYVDTPWREQVQWWGDAQVQASNTFHLVNDARLLRRGIDCIAAQRTPDGLTYGHAPTMAHQCVLVDFCLIWILTLWDHYWQTGSTAAFEDNSETVDSVLVYFLNSMDSETDLVHHDGRYRFFLDWTELHRIGFPSALSLWLVLALDRLAQLCTLTKRRKEAVRLRAWSARLREALKMLIRKDGLLRDGYDGQRRMVKETSIHVQTLAMMTNLHPASEPAILRKILLPYIREEREFFASPSAYWVTNTFDALQKRGYGREVLEFIGKHWSSMAEYGTTWENFSPVLGRESFSHAWSAHPISHFARILGGLTQTAPAWREIDFQPLFMRDECEVIIPSAAGPLRSAWVRRGGEIKVHLDIPRGVSARVRLPGIQSHSVTKSASWQVSIGVESRQKYQIENI